MIFFILGVALVAGSIVAGIPLYLSNKLVLGGAIAFMAGGGLVGITLAVVGLMIGKSPPREKKAPAPVPSPFQEPPPPPRAGPVCPTCRRPLAPGQNRCNYCFPPEAAPAAPPPPPPPVQADIAKRGRGAQVGPNGYLQILEGPAAGKQVAIKPGITITIGRGPGNFIEIQDPEVSGNHAQLICDNDRIDFYDLGSSNGSFLADGPDRPEQRLTNGIIRSGNVLRLGRTTRIYFSYK